MISFRDFTQPVGNHDAAPHRVAKLCRNVDTHDCIEQVVEWRAGREAELLPATELVVLEIRAARTQHAETLVRISKRERHTPLHFRAG